MTKKIDMKKSYEFLQKKFKLPKFQNLDDDFEVSFLDYKLEDAHLLLRSIRRKMNEKVIFFCRIIEGVLYPQQATMISMVESKQLTEEEKHSIHEFYKKLMYYERESLKLDVLPSEEQSAVYIQEVYTLWNQFRDEMHHVVEKMQKSWQHSDEEDTETFVG